MHGTEKQIAAARSILAQARTESINALDLSNPGRGSYWGALSLEAIDLIEQISSAGEIIEYSNKLPQLIADHAAAAEIEELDRITALADWCAGYSVDRVWALVWQWDYSEGAPGERAILNAGGVVKTPRWTDEAVAAFLAVARKFVEIRSTIKTVDGSNA